MCLLAPKKRETASNSYYANEEENNIHEGAGQLQLMFTDQTRPGSSCLIISDNMYEPES